MRQAMDQKFSGVIVKNKNGEFVPPDEWMCFLIKDNAFPNTLRFYRDECIRLGAGQEQVEAIDDAIKRMDEWRRNNPERCKIPDVESGELIA